MENRQIPDQPAIPMDQVRLGDRYSSEDMYRDYPDLMPGARVTFEKNTVLYTDTVQDITLHSAEPEIIRQLSWWQRAVRRLTPPRYRKSLVIRPYKPETVTVTTGPVDDDVRERFERTQRSLQQADEFIDELIRSEPLRRPD